MTETNNSQPATKGDLADLRTVLTTDITDLRTELKTDIKNLDQKIDQKFGQIDQKFGQIDQKFGQIDQKFGQIDQKFGQIDQKFGQIDQKFGQIDQKFGQIDKTLLSLGVEVSKTNSRMDTLENNIMTELRSFKSDLLSAYEASVMKGQMYSQKAMTHGDILSGHEEKLLNHETRLASLESK